MAEDIHIALAPRALHKNRTGHCSVSSSSAGGPVSYGYGLDEVRYNDQSISDQVRSGPASSGMIMYTPVRGAEASVYELTDSAL